MRKGSLLLVLLALTVHLTANDRQPGKLFVISTPPDCWVRIDSVLVGKTPLNGIEITPGKHLIQVSPPETGLWQLTDKIFTVDIKPGAPLSVRAEFDRPIVINSIPYGAEVLRDSIPLGTTPLYLAFSENRGHLFRLFKQGFEPYEFKLTERKSLLVRLTQSSEIVPIEKKPRFLGLVSRKKNKNKFALLAVTVATHWASFYFKNIADDRYNKYLRTANPELIDSYWNQTRKYDRLSEISLGISYASLAGLIYLVVWH